MVTIPKSEIFDLVSASLKNSGLCDEKIISDIHDHLIHNEMSGKQSHGLLRVKGCVNSIKRRGLPTGSPALELDNGSIAIVDGNNNIGLVAAKYAMQVAASKAKELGISFVGAKNYHGTTGTMNYYNNILAKQGLIGIAGCNSLAMVCHPDGLDPVIGTNPISFGIPSSKTPCIIDVTTAQWSYGKLLDLAKNGLNIPVDAFVDKNGKPSTDIKDAMDGVMLPMNGIKGFALGLAIEILSGALIGAKMGANKSQESDGIFFIAINPDMFVGQDLFESKVEKLLQEIKSSQNNTQVTNIFIPGEISSKKHSISMSNDVIDITESVYQELKGLAQ